MQSLNAFQKAQFSLRFTRQRAQLRQELRDSLPALKIGQVVFAWRGDAGWKMGRVIQMTPASVDPVRWNARVERRGQWSVDGPVELFHSEPPRELCGTCQHEFYPHQMAAPDICATCAQRADEREVAPLPQIRRLAKQRAADDPTCRKIFNICRAVQR
jgi:hypothetical protein